MTAFVGFRTFLAAALGAVASGVGIIIDPYDWRGWAGLALSAVMAGLRAVTTTPPGKAEPLPPPGPGA